MKKAVMNRLLLFLSAILLSITVASAVECKTACGTQQSYCAIATCEGTTPVHNNSGDYPSGCAELTPICCCANVTSNTDGNNNGGGGGGGGGGGSSGGSGGSGSSGSSGGSGGTGPTGGALENIPGQGGENNGGETGPGTEAPGQIDQDAWNELWLILGLTLLATLGFIMLLYKNNFFLIFKRKKDDKKK